MSKKSLKRTLSLDRVNSLDVDSSGDEGAIDESCTAPTNRKASVKKPRKSRRNVSNVNSLSQPTGSSNVIKPPNSDTNLMDTNVNVNLNANNLETTVVVSLRAEIASLQETVRSLSTQVNFLLSFVGAVSSSPSFQLPQQSADAGTDTSHNSSTTNQSVHQLTTAPNYSAVVQQPATISGVHHGPRSFREAAVAAVYADKAETDRRSASFIVSGMSASNSSSDRDLVARLCIAEFGVNPDIAFTKRLGRYLPGKVQPLLVYLKQTDQAKNIVATARQLRQSHDVYTRENIYINENLTKAAAQVAFEIRCRRRHAANQRSTSRHPGHGQVSNQPNVSLPVTAELISGQSATSSVLDAIAPPFVPNNNNNNNSFA